MGDIYTLGIDVGSTASKCIIMKNGEEIVAKSLIDVGAGTSGPKRAIEIVLEKAGMTEQDLDYTLATGYGRNSLMGLADKQMSELSCHARGAYYLFPKVHTVMPPVRDAFWMSWRACWKSRSHSSGNSARSLPSA